MRKLASIPLFLVFLTPAGAGGGSPRPATVTLVCRIEGSATLRPAPGASPEPLAPGRRLLPGAVLEAGPRAAITVVFFDGQRQVLQAGARATARAAGLHAEAGEVRPLTQVPAIVDLAPVLRESAGRSPRPAASSLRAPGERRRPTCGWEILSGPVLQALLLETILDGAPVRSPGRAALLAALALVATAAAASTLLGRRPFAATAVSLTAVAWVAAAFALFAARRLLVPIAPPLAVLLLVVGLAAALRKWLPPFPHSLYGV